jgi:hypothetical protein
MRRTSEEVLDLVEQPVDVSTSGKPQSVVPGLLEIAGAGYLGCEIASVAWGGHDVVPEQDGFVPTLLSDINMLVITGGQESTNADYGDLLAAAGLTIGKVHPVTFPYGVIEGLPA